MGGQDIFGDVGWSILSVLALLAALYVLPVFIIGRIRLTDWLGYIVVAGAVVRAYRNNPDMVLTGLFTVGRPPERVKDWPNRSRPGKDKPPAAE